MIFEHFKVLCALMFFTSLFCTWVYLWKQMGKKYTCADERNQMKAFIIDSKQDATNRADCLEKQLDKY